MNVHCFYHRADLDGHCCGAIVREWCERRGLGYVPHGVDYGDDVNWLCDAGVPRRAVIADFTPEKHPGDILLAMRNWYDELTWIDHHKTALEQFGIGVLDSVPGPRVVGTAACVLTWRHFFPDEKMPPAVKWLGQYDVFDRDGESSWEQTVLPFQYGMRLRDTNPDGTDEKGLWNMLLTAHTGSGARKEVEILLQGETCLAYERKNNAKTAKAEAYDCEFDGRLCCAINARGNSLVLDAYARPEHKMRILWALNGAGKWKAHLYENGHPDVDCGIAAKAYGGGGHKGAAGFELPPGVHPEELFARKENTK